MSEITLSNEPKCNTQRAVVPVAEFPHFLMADFDVRLAKIQEMTRRILASPAEYDQYCEHLLDHLIGISKEVSRSSAQLDGWFDFLTDGEISTWGADLWSQCTSLLALASVLGEQSECAQFRSEFHSFVKALEVFKLQAIWCVDHWHWWNKYERRHNSEPDSVPETIDHLISKCENCLRDLRENGEMHSWAPKDVREIWSLAMRLGSPFIKMPAIADVDHSLVMRRQYAGDGDVPIWNSSQVNEYFSFVTTIREWCSGQVDTTTTRAIRLATPNIQYSNSEHTGRGSDDVDDAASPEVVTWAHESGEPVPTEFCTCGDPQRPCGPVVGTMAELGFACHPGHRPLGSKQYRRQLETAATGRVPRVWIRRVNRTTFEAFFRSKLLSDQAKTRVQDYRSSPPQRKRGSSKDAEGLQRTSKDVGSD